MFQDLPLQGPQKFTHIGIFGFKIYQYHLASLPSGRIGSIVNFILRKLVHLSPTLEQQEVHLFHLLAHFGEDFFPDNVKYSEEQYRKVQFGSQQCHSVVDH
jgi:hypothetical protein